MTSSIKHADFGASEFVLFNARLVLPDRVVDGRVQIRDGKIADIDDGVLSDAGDLDLGGDLLMPGLVDIHTDHFERHVYPRPHVRWDYFRAALAHDAQIIGGGVTTVFDSLCAGNTFDNPNRREIVAPMIEAIEAGQRDGMLKAEHFIHLRAEITDEGAPDLIAANIGRDSVRVISVMEHLPGIRQSRDVKHFIARTQARTGATTAEVEADIAELIAEKTGIGRDTRPRIVALAREHHLPLLSHDDTDVAHVEQAFEEGGSVSEFPCTLEAARAAHAHGMLTVAGAPNYLRGGSQSGNVAVADLLAEGLVDILASDYVPRSLLDCALALARDEALDIDLPHAVALVSSAPARAAGLTDRGSLETGLRADLIQVGLSESHPYVRRAWRQGERVY